MKKRLKRLMTREDQTLSKVVKELLGERLVIEELEEAKDWPVPNWVPEGKYVALVKGAVAAVGDSIPYVLDQAVSRFKHEAIQVKRKGKPISKIEYSFFASAEVRCWRYASVGENDYPILPATVIGKSRVDAAAIVDTASSLTLAKKELIDNAGLDYVTQRKIHTAQGSAAFKIFGGKIELATGTYKVEVAEASMPKEFPVRLIVGRNVLDSIDTYILGKRHIICIKDP